MSTGFRPIYRYDRYDQRLLSSRRSKDLRRDSANNFQNIVDEIVKQDSIKPEEMTSYSDWDNWYEDRRNNISTSLS